MASALLDPDGDGDLQAPLLNKTEGTLVTNPVQALGGGWELDKERPILDVVPEATREEMRSRRDYHDKTLAK